MYLVIKTLFILISLLLSLFLVLQKTYICKVKDSKKTSPLIASMAVLMILYTIMAGCLALIINGFFNKIIMVIFGASPFLIGKFATYEKEKFYSLLQIFCILLSVLCVYLI